MPNAFTDKPSLNTLVSGQDMPEIAGRVLTFLDGASLSQYAQSAKSPSEIAKKQWALNVKEHLISDDSSLTAIPHGQEKDFYTSIYQRYIKTAESLLQNRSILREKFIDEEGRTFRKRSILHIIWYVGLNQLFTQLLTKVIHEYRTTEVLKAELNTALFEANFDAPSLLALAAENDSISIFHLLSEDELRRTANDPNIFRSARSLELSALLLKYHANPVAQIKNSDFLASIIKSQNLKLLQHVLAQLSPEERSDILKTEEGAVSFLHLAAETGNQAIFMEVLKTIPKEERARPLLRKTSDQENLLHAAAKYGNGAFVKGIATLMAEAQAQGRGEGQVEACRKEFLRQLSTRNYSPIDIAAGSNNDQALSYFMGLLSEEEQRHFICGREFSMLKLTASVNATTCLQYLWEHGVSRLNDIQKYRIAVLCLEANTKNGRVAGTYFQAKEAMDFILSQFPDPAVKERLLNDSKALLNSLTKNNGLFSKIIQSYPNKYRLKELLRTYLGSAGVLEELPRALVSSYYSVKDLEEVFKLFEPDEVKDFITAGSLLYVCLREIPPDLVSANRRGAFIYLLSRLSLEERARVLTEPNEADGHLLLNLTNLFNIIYFDEIAALLPNNEQIDCLGLSDWAKGVWRNFCRDPWHSASLFHEEEEPEENGPQP